MTALAQAIRIAEEHFGPVERCERFPTGLVNWVYDVDLESGRSLVVRMSGPASRDGLAGCVHWTRLLRQAGVPVAEVLHHDLEAPQPYLILERLPGTDLGNVFDGLSEADLEQIATTVADWQQLTQLTVPSAAGFGFATPYGNPLKPTWAAAVHRQLDRSEQHIRAAGVVDPHCVDRIRSRVRQATTELDEVPPHPFLHDATTKNVIIHNRTATGLVDVDQMAFGDPLYIAALTRMSLIAASRPTRYADHLASLLASDTSLLDLYTAVHCIGFLAELGQRHNQEHPAPIDPLYRSRLDAALRSLT